MKKIIIVLLILSLIGFLVIIFLPRKGDNLNKKILEYREEGQLLTVLNEKNEIILEYSIFEFRKWAKENWQIIFEIPPAFGELRRVDPEHFYRFDETAALSFNNQFIAFSVNDYAALTNISFVGIINIKTKEIFLIKDKNIGSLEQIFWSPENNYLAYILDTARSGGDYLSVDNIPQLKKEFTLSNKDILNYFSLENNINEFMPNFREIKWSEGGKTINFISDNQNNEPVNWLIDFNGKNLKKIDN